MKPNQHHSGSGDNIGRDRISNAYTLIITRSIGVLAIILLLVYIAVQIQVQKTNRELAREQHVQKMIEQQRRVELLEKQRLLALKDRQDAILRKMHFDASHSYEVKYIDIIGNTIDYLIENNTIKQHELIEIFGNKPILLTNAVTSELRELKKEYHFNIKHDAEFRYAAKNINLTNKTKALLTKDELLAATNPRITKAFIPFCVNEKDVKKVTGLKVYTLKNHIEYGDKNNEKYGYPDVGGLQLNKYEEYLTKEKINKFYKIYRKYFYPSGIIHAYLGLYNHVAYGGLPPKFIKLFWKYNGCWGCYEVRFTTPVLKVRAAYIRNVSKNNIEVTGLKFRSIHKDTLRTVYDDKKARFSYSKAEYHIVLAPNQSIVIPVYYYFEVDEIAYHNQTETIEGPIEINKPTNDNKKQYIYGSSYALDSLIINDCNFAANQDYKSKEFGLYINGSQGGGSCPYIYTRLPNKKEYYKEAHILYKRSSESKVGWDTLKLKRFDGSILIKEIDDEESYLDVIEVHFKDDKNILHKLSHNKIALINKDNKYYTMNKGDTLTIRFSTYDRYSKMKGEYYLVANGYYEIYNSIRYLNLHQKAKPNRVGGKAEEVVTELGLGPVPPHQASYEPRLPRK